MDKRGTTTVSDWLRLLSPGGQQQLVDFIRQARDERGSRWIHELKDEFPFASWLIGLVANRTADEALADLSAEYPSLPVRIVGSQIRLLHARIKFEIEKKR